MLSHINHILLDYIPSWPEEVKEMLRENRALLAQYIEEEKRIDTLAEKDIRLRINRPTNSLEEGFNSIEVKLSHLLGSYRLLGFHCSRLLDHEIDEIFKNGLQPLTREFANARIKKAFEQGYLTRDIRDRLLSKEEFNDPVREGRIFFFHCLETLRNESGLENLLGFWGGEAINWSSKDRHHLQTIGTPCIVLGSLSVESLQNFFIIHSLGKRIIGVFLQSSYYGRDFDSWQNKPVEVLDIIKRENDLFERLTGCNTWNIKL